MLKPDLLAAVLSLSAQGGGKRLPTDPRVLDPNGDGVKLTSFSENPVLFDINNNGSKELTGWVNPYDGMVVMDLNGNGKIDGMHEMMSEYFNGSAVKNGEAGQKRFANGFEALASLDSNGDKKFTNADKAWNQVKVWVDSNQNGITDAGELKTLNELNITSIDLTPKKESGKISQGNEILATGSFVQNGQTKEAQAASFIADPTGMVFSSDNKGTTVKPQGGQSSYVSASTKGEHIDLKKKGVQHAYGGKGNDTLIGDAQANWLVGGAGSDTFHGGDSDDILCIDPGSG